ncbi:MAG: hypothetical protein ACP5P1_11455 [Acidimicrobiales bacterium]
MPSRFGSCSWVWSPGFGSISHAPIAVVLARPSVVIDVDAKPQSALAELRDAGLQAAPATDQSGRFCGVVREQEVARLVHSRQHTMLRDMLHASVVSSFPPTSVSTQP